MTEEHYQIELAKRDAEVARLKVELARRFSEIIELRAALDVSEPHAEIERLKTRQQELLQAIIFERCVNETPFPDEIKTLKHTLLERNVELFRAANIFKAICEAGQDDPSAAIQALEAMPFVRDLIRDRACDCPMGEIDKHDPGCRLRAP
jgi:hypothetical protein